MRKSHFNDEFLVLLGPTISRLFTCSNEEKTKGACSSAISMVIMNVVMLNVVALEKNRPYFMATTFLLSKTSIGLNCPPARLHMSAARLPICLLLPPFSFICHSMSVCQPTCLPACLPTNFLACLPTCLPACLCLSCFVCLSIHATAILPATSPRAFLSVLPSIFCRLVRLPISHSI